MKRVLLIGAKGTIGSAVKAVLEEQAEIIEVGRESGAFQVDLGDSASIKQLFESVKPVDAVISVGSGPVVFKPVTELNVQDYRQSLQVKGLGQIDLALQAIPYLKDGGSITLTTGILNHDFIPAGSAAAMVNAAIEGFVRSASLELPRSIRLNIVSPGLIEESKEKYADFFPGFEAVSARRAALAYRKSVYGIRNGHVFHVTP